MAQAIHWFDLESFFQEVEKVLKKRGVLAVWGYGLFQFENDNLNDTIHWFYNDIMGPYWDPQRRLVDDLYQDIVLPFEKLEEPEFRIPCSVSIKDILNFFNRMSIKFNLAIAMSNNSRQCLMRRID